MIVCESQFKTPDPKNRAIAQQEIDFYQSGDHRLSLRYRFDPGRYEVYKAFYAQPDKRQGEVIIFRSPNLQLALDRGGEAWRERFGSDREPDQVCRHEYPVKAHGCKVAEDAD